MSLYLINPIEKPTNQDFKSGEINILERCDLFKTLNEFNSKHLSSTYKSYVKNLPGDNYIKREKSKHSSSSSHGNITITDVNMQQQPMNEQQQQQTLSPPQQPKPLGGLTRLVEGNYPDEHQQELILLSLDDQQLRSAFTLQDGGYQRPDKDKKRDKKHKKKRKHRDGSTSGGGSGSGGNDPMTSEHDKKKKSKKDRDHRDSHHHHHSSDNNNNHHSHHNHGNITVEH